MAANVETMVFVESDGVPWHGLGTSVTGAMTAQEAIGKAGLDWLVEMRPVFQAVGGGYLEIPRRKACVRVTDDSALGVFSDSYVPLQNADAFGFFDKVVGEGQAIYRTAGALDEGRKVWILAQLPKAIEPVAGDKILPYLVLCNSFDGSLAVHMYFTSIRVVCENTLMASFTKEGNSYTARHVGGLMGKVDDASQALGFAAKHYEVLEAAMREMQQVSIDAQMVLKFGEKLFPDRAYTLEKLLTMEQGEYLKSWAAQRRQMLADLVETGAGVEIPGVKGTAYGLYQAAAEVISHSFKDYRTAENKLESQWFGQAANRSRQAFDLAMQLGKN